MMRRDLVVWTLGIGVLVVLGGVIRILGGADSPAPADPTSGRPDRDRELPSFGKVERRDSPTPSASPDRQQVAPDGSARVRQDVGLDVGRGVELLSLAEDPTQENVTVMLRRIFSLDDPRPVLAEILEALAGRRLTFEEANAACLVLETALHASHSEGWRRKFGPADGPKLVSDLLESLVSMGDEATARLVRVLSEGRFLGSSHLSEVETLLAQDPLPGWAGVLAGSYLARQGMADRGDDLAIALRWLDRGDPELSAIVLKELVGRGDADFLGLALRGLFESETVDERGHHLMAIARGASVDVSLPLLRETARWRDPDSGPPDVHLFAAFSEALRKATPEQVWKELELEGDGEVRSLMVATLGEGHEDLLFELASGVAYPDLRDPALVMLTSMRKDTDVGDVLLDRLWEVHASTREPVLVSAARNLFHSATLSSDASWVQPTKELLLDWVRDSGSEMWIRQQTLRAILPALDPHERLAIVSGAYPQELKEIVRR